MDNCTVDCIQINGHLNLEQMCRFTQDQCVQDTVQFIQAYFCVIKQSFIIMIILSALLFYFLFGLINFINDNYLTKTVEQFIGEFKISQTLAGVTFLAFANGAPDVLTAIIAGSSDSASTALIPFGSIFGAGLFSTSFILSAVIFCQQNNHLKVQKKKILIPLGFYLSGLSYLMITSATYGKMNIGISLGLIVLYIIYIGFQLKTQKKERKNKRLLQQSQLNNPLVLSSTNSQSNNIQMNSDNLILNQQFQKQPSEEQLTFFGRLNESKDSFYSNIFCYFIPPYSHETWGSPHKIIISLILSPFGLAFTQQMPDIFVAMVFTDKDGNGGFPVFLLMSTPALLLLIFSVYKIFVKKSAPDMKIFAIYSFLVIIGWITLFCSILINLIELIQLLTKINSIFLGLTVLAWANCLGDYLSITKFAKLGIAHTAVAGIFSGQLFNFLMGFGVSLTMQSLANGTFQFNIFKFESGSTYVAISDSMILLIIVCGFLYLIYTFYKVLKKGVLERADGTLSKSFYAIFLLLALLLALIADFFYEISCNVSIFGRKYISTL